MRRSEQHRRAVVAVYQHELTGRPIAALLPRDTTDFTRELAEGAEAERNHLDELVGRYAVGWTLDRIAPLERSIMRVALFEMLHRPDIPDEVAIDQAVDTAKELCGAEAPGFVNGILGAVERERVAAG